jgi:hypothetical protein
MGCDAVYCMYCDVMCIIKKQIELNSTLSANQMENRKCKIDEKNWAYLYNKIENSSSVSPFGIRCNLI